jgi:hypothetical protein
MNKFLLVVALMVGALVVAAAAKNVPDVNRYRKMRAM